MVPLFHDVLWHLPHFVVRLVQDAPFASNIGVSPTLTR
jgi:hypothetical protein